MKKKINRLAALGLAALLLTVPAKADAGFCDVDDSADYAAAVEYVSEAGIMNGDVGRQFNPNRTVTRAQMAAIVCRMVGEYSASPAGRAPFRDVPASYWASGYIQKAASLNIIGGFEDGSFRPENTLSANQGITMLIRAFGLRDEAEDAGGYPNGYLAVARKHNVLDGITVRRASNLKRYEIAVMIYNYYEGDGSPAGEEGLASTNSLADGEYSMRISLRDIGTDGAGNETAHAEVLEAVVLDDSYVRSLNVGDTISLKKYGLDDEIAVERPIRESSGEIYLNDYTYLSRQGRGWKIYQYDLLIEYSVDETKLVLSPDTVVIDGFTSIMETGELKERQLGSLREFFENPLAGTGERRVIVTIAGGKVAKIFIPYTPM